MMDGDLKTYVSEKRLKMAEALERLKTSRGLTSRIMKTLSKHGYGMANVDDFIGALTMAGEHGKGLYDYTIEVKGNTTYLTFEIGDMYFVADGMIRNLMPRFHRKSHDSTDISKEAWQKWFERELRKYCEPENIKKEILEDELSKPLPIED